MNNDSKISLVFFGTSRFAEVILESLLQSNRFTIKIVITQPDKPVGRKKILTPSPVRVLSEKNNIPVLTPTKLNEIKTELKNLNPDVFLVVAYGKFIPQSIIDIASNKFINIHPSLLPKYRGPSPIQFALLNDDKSTGTTIMNIDSEMDHGNIIFQAKFDINPDDNFLTLQDTLAAFSADLFIKSISKYLSGEIKSQEQNHDAATLTKIIEKTDGEIKSSYTATQIIQMLKAYTPWPGIFGNFEINNKKLKIKLLDIEPANLEENKKPLTVFANDKKLYLSCADNIFLEIKKLQPEGRNPLTAIEFINGYLN